MNRVYLTSQLYRPISQGNYIKFTTTRNVRAAVQEEKQLASSRTPLATLPKKSNAPINTHLNYPSFYSSSHLNPLKATEVKSMRLIRAIRTPQMRIQDNLTPFTPNEPSSLVAKMRLVFTQKEAEKTQGPQLSNEPHTPQEDSNSYTKDWVATDKTYPKINTKRTSLNSEVHSEALSSISDVIKKQDQKPTATPSTQLSSSKPSSLSYSTEETLPSISSSSKSTEIEQYSTKENTILAQGKTSSTNKIFSFLEEDNASIYQNNVDNEAIPSEVDSIDLQSIYEARKIEAYLSEEDSSEVNGVYTQGEASLTLENMNATQLEALNILDSVIDSENVDNESIVEQNLPEEHIIQTKDTLQDEVPNQSYSLQFPKIPMRAKVSIVPSQAGVLEDAHATARRLLGLDQDPQQAKSNNQQLGYMTITPALLKTARENQRTVDTPDAPDYTTQRTPFIPQENRAPMIAPEVFTVARAILDNKTIPEGANNVKISPALLKAMKEKERTDKNATINSRSFNPWKNSDLEVAVLKNPLQPNNTPILRSYRPLPDITTEPQKYTHNVQKQSNKRSDETKVEIKTKGRNKAVAQTPITTPSPQLRAALNSINEKDKTVRKQTPITYNKTYEAIGRLQTATSNMQSLARQKTNSLSTKTDQSYRQGYATWDTSSDASIMKRRSTVDHTLWKLPANTKTTPYAWNTYDPEVKMSSFQAFKQKVGKAFSRSANK